MAPGPPKRDLGTSTEDTTNERAFEGEANATRVDPPRIAPPIGHDTLRREFGQSILDAGGSLDTDGGGTPTPPVGGDTGGRVEARPEPRPAAPRPPPAEVEDDDGPTPLPSPAPQLLPPLRHAAPDELTPGRQPIPPVPTAPPDEMTSGRSPRFAAPDEMTSGRVPRELFASESTGSGEPTLERAPPRSGTGLIPSPARLIVVRGADAGREFPLATGETSLGRGKDNRIVLADITVSRHHVVFVAGVAKVHVRDLGSGNGTWLSGVPLSGEAQLADGDTLELGRTLLRFESRARKMIDAVTVEEPPPPPPPSVLLPVRPGLGPAPFVRRPLPLPAPPPTGVRLRAPGRGALLLVGTAAVAVAVAITLAATHRAPRRPQPTVAALPEGEDAAPAAVEVDAGRRETGALAARAVNAAPLPDAARAAVAAPSRPSPPSRPGPGRQSAVELYAARKFERAAALLDELEPELARDYRTVGAAFARGEAAESGNPVAAMLAYEDALHRDTRLGGYHATDLRARLARVAPRAARSLFDTGRYEQARAACESATAYGVGGDSTVLGVRTDLEQRAAELYAQALAILKKKPIEARALLHRVQGIVPRSSRWYGKAGGVLAELEAAGEDE